MPRAGGPDFTLIVTHYVFLVTFVLAIVGWMTAFIGQVVLEAITTANPPTAGTLWFGIFLHAAVIGGVAWTLATDSIALNRLQISVFAGLSIYYAVEGAHEGIYSPLRSAQAMGAGYLLLAFVFITWTLYFTAEEGSLTLDIMNTFGTGGLTGPGRRRTVVGGGGIARSPSNGYIGGGTAGGIGGGMGSGMGGAPYSPQSYSAGGGGFGNIGMGMGGQAINQENKSQYSVNNPLSNRPIDARSLGGQSTGGQSGVQTEKRLGSPTSGVGAGGISGSSTENPGAPLVPGPYPVSPPNPPTDAGNTEVSQYRARALYAYTASADDPNEISFAKNDILDVIDNSGKWWQARKADGTAGIAPSNYLQLL